MAEIKKNQVEPRVQEPKIQEPKTETTNKPKKRSWEFERQRDSKMVRGKFINHEAPGCPFSFSYYAYEGEPVKEYTLQDGEIRELPLGVAKHLNNVGYPVHEHTTDENGKPLMRIGTFERRCSFQSLDFMPDSSFDDGPKLYTAEFETSDNLHARK